jgi:hypothetical protein
MKRAGLVVAVGALLVMLSAAAATAVVRSGTSGKDVLYGTAYAEMGASAPAASAAMPGM